MGELGKVQKGDINLHVMHIQVVTEATKEDEVSSADNVEWDSLTQNYPKNTDTEGKEVPTETTERAHLDVASLRSQSKHLFRGERSAVSEGENVHKDTVGLAEQWQRGRTEYTQIF